ncbi:MAG: WD40 repeat domain-containing protein [Crocosphaera sp.]|nr:WD40 repeat domain-containing protein [Crocosphaera sp.]
MDTLTKESAKKAIEKPIERYNFVQHIRNYPLTIFSGDTHQGKSSLLKNDLVNYFKPMNEFQSKVYCFSDNSKRNTDTINEIVKAWDTFQNPSQDKSTILIFENFYKYIEQLKVPPKENSEKELLNKIILLGYDVQQSKTNTQSNKIRCVIEIRDISELRTYCGKFKDKDWNLDSDINIDIDKLCSNYFKVSNNPIKVDENVLSSDFSVANFSNRVYRCKLIDSIIDILNQGKKIPSPYLQLIMYQWWKNSSHEKRTTLSLGSLSTSKEENNRNIKLTKEEKKALKKNLDKPSKDEKLHFKNIREKIASKLAKKGIEIILEQYLEKVIEKAIEELDKFENDKRQKSNSNNSAKNLTAFTTRQEIYRFTYHLYAISKKQKESGEEPILNYINEATKTLKLPLPPLAPEQVDKYLDYCTEKRIIQPFAVGSPPSIYYEIFFDALIHAIETYRQKHLDYILCLQKHQQLTVKSLACLRENQGELAALLAQKSYDYRKNQLVEIENYKENYKIDNKQEKDIQNLLISEYKVDKCLLEVLKSSTFDSSRLELKNENDWVDNRLEESTKPLRDFRQVIFSPDGSFLVASNQNGNLGFCYLTRKDSLEFKPEVNGLKSIDDSKRKPPHDPQEKREGLFIDIAITFISSKKFISVARDGKINLWDIENSSNVTFQRELKQEQKGELKQEQVKEKEQLVSVAFNEEKKLLAVGSWEGYIRLWDMKDPDKPKFLCKQLWRDKPKDDSDKPKDNWIWSIAFHPDGDLLAVGGKNGVVCLSKINDQNILEKTPLGEHNEVFCVTFSPNGKWLAVAGRSNHICLYQCVQTGKSKDIERNNPIFLKGHKDNVRTLTFNSDSTLLASGSEDQTIRIWNLEEIKKTSEKIEKIKDESKEESLKTPIPIHESELNNCQLLHGHQHGVCSVAFDPNNPHCLASCSWDRTIRFWYLQGHIDSEPKSFIGYPENKDDQNRKDNEDNSNRKDIDVIAASFISQNQVVVGYRNGVILLRDINQSSNSKPIWKVDLLQTLKKKYKNIRDLYIHAIAFYHKNNQLQKIALSGQKDNDPINILWDVSNANSEDGKKLSKDILELDEHQLSEIWQDISKIEKDISQTDKKVPKNLIVKSLSFNSDGTVLAICGHPLKQNSEEHDCDIWRIQLWDISKDKPSPKRFEQLSKYFKIRKDGVASVAFSSVDKNLLAIAGNIKDSDNCEQQNSKDKQENLEGDQIRFGNIENPKSFDQAVVIHKKRYGGKAPVVLAFSPDGKQLASGSDSNDITLWKINEKQELEEKELAHLPKQSEDSQELPTYNFWITALAFNNHNHKQLASGRCDGSIQIWDLQDLEKLQDDNYKPKILKHHEQRVNALTFRDDGEKLVSVSNDDDEKKLLVWTVSTDKLADKLKKRLYRELTPKEEEEYLGGKRKQS